MLTSELGHLETGMGFTCEAFCLVVSRFARSGQCERLVREPDRRLITGVSRTQWWALERKRVAPAKVRLGGNSVAWRLSDLLAWIEQRAMSEGG